MNFASDNCGPAHPQVIEALTRANTGFARSYGADDLTAQACARLRDLFEAQDLGALSARIDRQRDAEGRVDRAAGDLEELAESLRGLDGSEIDRLLERTEGAL